MNFARKARPGRVPSDAPEFRGKPSSLPVAIVFLLMLVPAAAFGCGCSLPADRESPAKSRRADPRPAESSAGRAPSPSKSTAPALGDSRVLFHETFDSLDEWKPLTLPKVARASRYEIVAAEVAGGPAGASPAADRVLRASSDDSASGLLWTRRFDPHVFSRLRWRWKVDNVYAKGDARKKSGDDYPLRIYVLFEYDPGDVGFFERLKYEGARLAGGEYPPVGVVHYMWSSREHDREILPNPYAERCRMFPLRAGAEQTGRWIEEEVDVLRDWRRAFGDRRAPRSATIAIMNDSDDTSERSVAFLDDLVVFRP